MLNIKKFLLAIGLVPKSTTEIDSQGELEVLNTDGKLRYHNGSSASPVVTESHSATLTNKTIDANGTGNSISNLETADLADGVLNTDLIDTLNENPASDTQIPSALAVKTYVDAQVDSKDEADEITVDPAVAGATNVQSALTNINTAINDHIGDNTDAHDASAISVSPSGNLGADDVQEALEELQTDIDTRATSTALTNHTGATSGAHAASAISVTPTGNLGADDVQEALGELQGDIDTLNTNKVTGPASATNDALARFDLTTGKLIQNSLAVLSDTGSLSGLREIKIYDPSIIPPATEPVGDKLILDKSGLRDILTSKGIEFSSAPQWVTPFGESVQLLLTGEDINLSGNTVLPLTVDTTFTGGTNILNPGPFSHVHLKNITLNSIREISERTEGSLLILTNETANDIEIINNYSSSAGILTGTESEITFRNKSSLFLTYNSQLSRWVVVGGTGGSAVSVKLTAGESLSINDLVYQDKGDGLIYKASNNDDDKVDVLGFVRKDAALGNPVEIITSGIIKGFTALSVGRIYYLELNGAITEFAPSINGTWVVPVAMAVSETEIVINPVASSSAIYITDSEYVTGLPNNQSSPDNMPDLLFDPIQVRSFIVDYSIYREDSLQGKAQVGQLRGVYNSRNAVWLMSDDFAGENAGVEFSVQPSGQVQYTTSNFLGTGHDCTVKYTIRRTFTI
jgi:hypothetical protein